MNIQNKLLELHRGVKRQRIIIEEESDDEFDAELVHEQQEEARIENDENSEPESEEIESEEDELVEFENGTTNKGNQCLWHKGQKICNLSYQIFRFPLSPCKRTILEMFQFGLQSYGKGGRKS